MSNKTDQAFKELSDKLSEASKDYQIEKSRRE